MLALQSMQHDTCILFDVASGKQLHDKFRSTDDELVSRASTYRTAFSSDDSHLIASFGQHFRVFDMAKGAAIGPRVECHDSCVYGIAVAPPSLGNECVVATCGCDEKICIWAIPALRFRWTRRVVVLRIANFGKCRLAKQAFDQYVVLRLTAKFL